MFLIETIIHNSYILLGKKKNRYSKTDYIEDLLNCYLPSEQIYEQNHFCYTTETQGRCVICYKRGQRKATHHKCRTCNRFVHSGDCYAELHNKKLKK